MEVILNLNGETNIPSEPRQKSGKNFKIKCYVNFDVNKYNYPTLANVNETKYSSSK